MKRPWLRTVTALGVVAVFLFVPAGANATEGQPRFTENKGQWPEQVIYKLRVANCDLYFESDRLTFNFYNPELLHQHGHSGAHEAVGHAYRMVFEGSAVVPEITGAGNRYPDHANYISTEHQVRKAVSYNRLRYNDVYPGVDLEYFGKEGTLKYDIRVDAGADPDRVRFRYEGVDQLRIHNGNLIVSNSFNTVTEQIPLAYQMIDEKQYEVACRYTLEEGVVGFSFPDGYDPAYELIIDPTLIFSSYTGSSADNFGFTATYDEDGALYGGGIAFALGYPTVTGSYSESFGGVIDMAISKFSADGTGLEYSTYIGGSSADVPHSMVVNGAGELVILGTTSSLDFPAIAGAYDETFNGGTSVNYSSNGTNFENGSDIVVVVLSADGTALAGATYFGGSLNDGLNEDATLTYNYGDIFRGEVIVDTLDNIYVTSSTVSADFPITLGALDQTLDGTQDGILAKFNSNASSLIWSTYIGGSSADAGYSVKLNSTAEIYVTGGTRSNDFPVAGSSLNPTFQGGSADGFVLQLSNTGNTVINGSYIGTSSYDQSYFVEVDDDDDIYLYGQSEGSYPVTGGTYFNVNGKQFIQKLSPDLSTSVYSTVFGSGSGTINISPTAFLVDICERVFISGWGGSTNNSWNPSTGSTSGLAVTQDAEQTTTDGSDFYFMVLEADATALLYGSYFGGAGTAEHVDGGTSRFNKDGVIHQAVCAGCGGSNAFPTTPGVVSNTNESPNCNLGVIKLDLEITPVHVEISSGNSTFGCVPLEVQFDSDLINATDFIWHFGDGTTSTEEDPTYTYEQPGVYEVWLIGTDTSFCTGDVFTDTAFTTVTVSVLTDAADAGPDVHLCSGQSAQIGADSIPGYSYVWNPDQDLSNAASPDPVADPPMDTEYVVTITNADGCEDTDTVFVSVFAVDAFPDTTLCAGDSIQVSVTGGTSFSWLPAGGVSDPTAPNPLISPDQATVYTVTASDDQGCEDTAQVQLGVLIPPEAQFDVEISQSCHGDSVQFVNLSSNAEEFLWEINGTVYHGEPPFIVFNADDRPLVVLSASNNDGLCTDTLVIDYSDGWFSEDSVLIDYPNVFTPNGDGVNDRFKPDLAGDLDDCFTLKVFSRWGRLLYDSEKHGGGGWDGTQRTNDLVAEGTYYYIASVRGMDHAGYVTVLYE